MSETTPPPEDDSFPQVYSMTSNSYTSAPAPAPTPVTNPAKLVPNYFASDMSYKKDLSQYENEKGFSVNLYLIEALNRMPVYSYLFSRQIENFCLFDLGLYSKSTIFLLCVLGF